MKYAICALCVISVALFMYLSYQSIERYDDVIAPIDNNYVVVQAEVSNIQQQVTNLTNNINGVPAEFVAKTRNMADSIASKIDAFAASMKGESDSTPAPHDTITPIIEKHFELLEDCRHNNPALYCLLLQISMCANNATISPTLQCGAQNLQYACSPQPIVDATNVLLLNATNPLTPTNSTLQFLSQFASPISQSDIAQYSP